MGCDYGHQNSRNTLHSLSWMSQCCFSLRWSTCWYSLHILRQILSVPNFLWHIGQRWRIYWRTERQCWLQGNLHPKSCQQWIDTLKHHSVCYGILGVWIIETAIDSLMSMDCIVFVFWAELHRLFCPLISSHICRCRFEECWAGWSCQFLLCIISALISQLHSRLFAHIFLKRIWVDSNSLSSISSIHLGTVFPSACTVFAVFVENSSWFL